MKAAFITIHVGLNFGSILQTLATNVVLKRTGCDEVVCVNYIPPRVTEKRYWQDAIQGPTRFLRRLLFYPVYRYSKYQYEHYLKKYCILSKPIYSSDSFPDKCPVADVYVSGSDQLWNFNHNEGCDIHYFFDGIKGRKIAFASSIGMTELPKDYAEYMKRSLREYDYVSVRETSAVKLLESWGITSTHVLDPTFMLGRDEWRPYSSKRLVKDAYVFVYLPYNTVDRNMIYKTVRKIAEKNNLKIVTYSDYFFKEANADRTICFVTPGDLLSLFYYAEIVVTNSFHGTAFSINLNKQFWVYMPSDFSTRIKSILDLCSLSHRLLTDVIKEEQMDERIDFEHTNKVIFGERIKALDFLKKALY